MWDQRGVQAVPRLSAIASVALVLLFAFHALRGTTLYQLTLPVGPAPRSAAVVLVRPTVQLAQMVTISSQTTLVLLAFLTVKAATLRIIACSARRATT